ncbi:MAG: hypothetical protein IJ423_05245 [Clostridia bacterium]|nr:hypothetical protein [Clostridia bacterium]MBQ8637374.1 hypothetical protein [Clostridia bacterium]
MKKYIITISVIILVLLTFDWLYFHEGVYFNSAKEKTVEYFTKVDGEEIYIKAGAEYKPFEIRGVNLGSGLPGKWATSFSIDEETYLRWFSYIQEMGANTIRIYTIQNDTFYNAFYEYNKDNPTPLYMIHGVWVNDYILNSHRDAYSKDFYDTFLDNSKIMVDVIHGKRKLNLGRVASAGHGTYQKDISDWVIGYILGVEWDDSTVSYTDDLYEGIEEYSSYTGQYMYTSPDATPFETMLTMVGDKVIEYETERYGEQRMLAFSNWPTTDPFEYPEIIKNFFMKCAYVNVEHIKTTTNFLSGQFASYHVYPYYPYYLSFAEEWSVFGLDSKETFRDEHGRINAYRAYLKMLNNHHTMPVVISEFGVSTGRGMAQVDKDTGRNQGNTSEQAQGQALIDCWNDIKITGCNGGCVFTWQDEWFKRTWNTMHSVNLTRTAYWSDYQTNEQYFGLLSFDPGKEKSVCYVDGDVSEWTENDKVIEGDTELSVKYDEKFMYFLVRKDGLDFENETLYIPLDITPKSGSNYCQNFGVKFDKDADFVIVINGQNNSRIMAQERYDALRSTYSKDIYKFDTYFKKNIPEQNSSKFVTVELILRTAIALSPETKETVAESYETGKLLYGNANPESPDFNSLADFISAGDYIEIKLPWQLMNFADPSKMQVHDDYYDGNYGIEYIGIDKMYAGVGIGNERIKLSEIKLKGWGNKVTYHERLKSSYYIMQDLWKAGD